jgi:hypothetical protein
MFFEELRARWTLKIRSPKGGTVSWGGSLVLKQALAVALVAVLVPVAGHYFKQREAHASVAKDERTPPETTPTDRPRVVNLPTAPPASGDPLATGYRVTLATIDSTRVRPGMRVVAPAAVVPISVHIAPPLAAELRVRALVRWGHSYDFTSIEEATRSKNDGIDTFTFDAVQLRAPTVMTAMTATLRIVLTSNQRKLPETTHIGLFDRAFTDFSIVVPAPTVELAQACDVPSKCSPFSFAGTATHLLDDGQERLCIEAMPVSDPPQGLALLYGSIAGGTWTATVSDDAEHLLAAGYALRYGLVSASHEGLRCGGTMRPLVAKAGAMPPSDTASGTFRSEP